MSGWVAGAVVVGAGISYLGSEKASKRSKKASDTQIAFEQEKYDDWQETYGPIEDNLSEYFNNLSPEYYEVQGLEAFEKEKTVAFEQLQESLAQRGISDSGIAIDIEKDLALESAQARARIRTEAPAAAASEKMRFLQVGLGQSPDASLSQTLAQRAQTATIESAQASAATGQAIQTAVSTVGTALADYNTSGAA